MKRLILLLILVVSRTLLPAQDLPAGKIWSLKDCLEYAVTNNITIQKAKLDNTAAAVSYRQAKNNRLPSVSATGALNVSNGYAIDPITSDFVNRTIVSNSYGLNGQMTLYQGNKLNLEIGRNQYLVEQSKLYEEQAENNITLSVLQAYLQALYYYEGIVIAENTLASSQAELALTQTKFDNGAIARKDLADVETQNAQNEYTLANSRTLYAQQVLKLKQLLELPPGYEFEIEKVTLPEAENMIPDKQEVYASALSQMPDVKIYEIQENILKKALAITIANTLPTLSIGAGLNTGYTNTMDYNYFTQMFRNFSQQANLTLSIPIFSKFQNRTNVQLARLDIRQNELDKISATKTLYANVETAWLNAVNNQAQQQAARVARDNAELAYDLSSKKYEFGGLTTTELAVSRNTYLSNEQTYLQTKYMTVLYKQLLNFYGGRSFDDL